MERACDFGGFSRHFAQPARGAAESCGSVCSRCARSVAARCEHGADSIGERRGRLVIELDDRQVDAVLAEAGFDRRARQTGRDRIEEDQIMLSARERRVESRLDVHACEAGIEAGYAERIAEWRQGVNPGPDEQDFHRA